MRLKAPRLSPLRDEELNDDQKEILSTYDRGGRVLNIFRTFVRAPKALKRFGFWGGYIMSAHNDLAPRDRELVILRTGYACKSGYEWAQHTRIGLEVGLTDAEIAQIKSGPDDPAWSDRDAAMLRAVDELVSNHFISDGTWQALSFLTEKQKMDLIFTTGQYTQVSMFLNSVGVQIEEGGEIDPDLRA